MSTNSDLINWARDLRTLALTTGVNVEIVSPHRVVE